MREGNGTLSEFETLDVGEPYSETLASGVAFGAEALVKTSVWGRGEARAESRAGSRLKAVHVALGSVESPF